MGTESGPTYGRTVGLACSQSRWNHCPEWLTSDPIEEEEIISETAGLARTTPFQRLLEEKVFFTKTSREFGLGKRACIWMERGMYSPLLVRKFVAGDQILTHWERGRAPLQPWLRPRDRSPLGGWCSRLGQR